jgi:hypothetical protein
MTSSRWPILGLDGDATEAQIRHAYATRLREQGPDAGVAQFAALRREFEAAIEHLRSHDVSRAESAASVLHSDGTAASAIGEIRFELAMGHLIAACRRYDEARAAGEIGFADEPPIETELAEGWLADTTLDAPTLAEIARRYGWSDVGTAFALAPKIAVRLRAASPGTQYIGRWNWGAFLLTPFWLIRHRRRRLAAGIAAAYVLLFFLPGVGTAGILGIAIWIGRRGNEIAVTSRVYRDEAQFVAVQNAWRNRGFVVWVGLCAAIAGLIANAR